MSFGSDYASIYDALYESKQYDKEAAFVLERLAATNNGRRPSNMLELGCGTGKHAIEFGRAGVDVAGYDVSASMIQLARKRLINLDPVIAARIRFTEGDARNLNTGRVFDAVLFLFHVMSYMADPDDFCSALRTARAHLAPGGLLFFDYWYGPAVLNEPPKRVERTFTDERSGKIVQRRTVPNWNRSSNRVDILYHISETNAGSSKPNISYEEEHKIRYYFDEDIRGGLEASGFVLVESRSWLSDQPPDPQTFGVYAIAKAK